MSYAANAPQLLPIPEVQSTATSPTEYNDFTFPDEGLFDNQMKFGIWDFFSF